MAASGGIKDGKDRVTVRRSADLFGVETITARYVRQSFKPHAHDEYLFGVIDGGVHTVWCRGEWHRVAAGSVVTMRPGDVHHGGAGHEAGWHQRMIYIPEPGLRSILSDIADREIAVPLDFGAAFHASPPLARRFAVLHDILHRSTETLARDEALDGLMREVLRELALDTAPLGALSPDGRMADVLDFMKSRVDEDISLDSLCAVSGLRRRQTIDAFRRHTGLPPHAWHIQQKIERVKSLLRQGMTATEAAAETGFSDQSHMTRHFNAIVGVTPGAYARA